MLLTHGAVMCDTARLQGVNDVAWESSGRYLATTSDDGTIRFWDVSTGKCLRVLPGHTNYVFCCAFNPHGNLLVRYRPL